MGASAKVRRRQAGSEAAPRRATMAAGAREALHFHDLRGTAVTMLAEAGCTVPEIATTTGHSLTHGQKILDPYLSRTEALAESVIAKLDDHRGNRRLQIRLQTGEEIQSARRLSD